MIQGYIVKVNLMINMELGVILSPEMFCFSLPYISTTLISITKCTFVYVSGGCSSGPNEWQSVEN